MIHKCEGKHNSKTMTISWCQINHKTRQPFDFSHLKCCSGASSTDQVS